MSVFVESKCLQQISEVFRSLRVFKIRAEQASPSLSLELTFMSPCAHPLTSAHRQRWPPSCFHGSVQWAAQSEIKVTESGETGETPELFKDHLCYRIMEWQAVRGLKGKQLSAFRHGRLISLFMQQHRWMMSHCGEERRSLTCRLGKSHRLQNHIKQIIYTYRNKWGALTNNPCFVTVQS